MFLFLIDNTNLSHISSPSLQPPAPIALGFYRTGGSTEAITLKEPCGSTFGTGQHA